MTLTNYTDCERELVKDMLRICGISYTGHLTRNNTHLICKRSAPASTQGWLWHGFAT